MQQSGTKQLKLFKMQIKTEKSPEGDIIGKDGYGILAIFPWKIRRRCKTRPFEAKVKAKETNGVIKETVGEAADRPKLRAEGKDHEISGKPQKYRA